MVHVTACLSVLMATLAGIFYLVLDEMRDNLLLDLTEFNEVRREWD